MLRNGHVPTSLSSTTTVMETAASQNDSTATLTTIAKDEQLSAEAMSLTDVERNATTVTLSKDKGSSILLEPQEAPIPPTWRLIVLSIW